MSTSLDMPTLRLERLPAQYSDVPLILTSSLFATLDIPYCNCVSAVNRILTSSCLCSQTSCSAFVHAAKQAMLTRSSGRILVRWPSTASSSAACTSSSAAAPSTHSASACALKSEPPTSSSY